MDELVQTLREAHPDATEAELDRLYRVAYYKRQEAEQRYYYPVCECGNAILLHPDGIYRCLTRKHSYTAETRPQSAAERDGKICTDAMIEGLIRECELAGQDAHLLKYLGNLKRTLEQPTRYDNGDRWTRYLDVQRWLDRLKETT